MSQTSVEAYLASREEAHLQKLSEFLKFPSISALSEHAGDVHRCTEWLAAYLGEVGLERTAVLPTARHPVVVGEWSGAGPSAPTALIYGHYDVQPVDPLHLWTTPPFEPQVRDGRIFARGSADDKGQVMVHLQAVEALLRVEGKLPVNIKVILEGEEEIGSPNLEPFIKANPDRVKADVVVISDTTLFDHGLPTISLGLRGLCDLEVHVRGPKSDLHSGLYGGAVANPIHVLAELLASLRHGQGRIAVAGFYDGVSLTQEERAQLAALPFDEEAFARALGVRALAGEEGYTALERMSVRPTLEVNGIWGGFQGEGTKTVIPSEAHAKITCRLVPDQDPRAVQEAVKAHLEAHCPPSASVEVVLGNVAKPWKCDANLPPIRAGVRALKAVYGKEVALPRSGGTIPVVGSFDRLLGVPCVLMGFAAPDCNAHAPDEHFEVETFRLARRALARYWQELAREMAGAANA